MAIGRVNVANVDVENLSIFEIDNSIDTTYERSFNVFSQVGTDSTRHQIFSEEGKLYPRVSYGREGNILFFKPIKKGEKWWVVEYNFDKGQFIKQQEVDLGVEDSAVYVSVQNDFNKVEISGSKVKKTVILGDIKTSTPRYGAWISDNISVVVEKKGTTENIVYYKNGNEEMFNIIKDYYFLEGFIFVSDKIAVVTTERGELQAAKIHDINNFTKQTKKDTSSLVGWFGGEGHQFIYDVVNDTFLDINIETGRVVEKRFVYKSVDW